MSDGTEATIRQTSLARNGKFFLVHASLHQPKSLAVSGKRPSEPPMFPNWRNSQTVKILLGLRQQSRVESVEQRIEQVDDGQIVHIAYCTDQIVARKSGDVVSTVVGDLTFEDICEMIEDQSEVEVQRALDHGLIGTEPVDDDNDDTPDVEDDGDDEEEEEDEQEEEYEAQDDQDDQEDQEALGESEEQEDDEQSESDADRQQEVNELWQRMGALLNAADDLSQTDVSQSEDDNDDESEEESEEEGGSDSEEEPDPQETPVVRQDDCESLDQLIFRTMSGPMSVDQFGGVEETKSPLF